MTSHRTFSQLNEILETDPNDPAPKSEKPPALPNRPTEDELAEVVLFEIGKDNLIGSHAGTMYWTGQRWESLADEQMRELVRSVLRELSVPVRRSLLMNLASLIKDRVFDPRTEFNRSEDHIVSVQNGDLLLLDNKWHLVPAERDRRRTAVLPHSYDPSATAQRFMQFLDEIFEDDPDAHEKSTLLLQHAGYALQTHSDLERFAIYVGSGANGKSVFLNAVKHLLGSENIAAVQPHKLNNTFHRASLHQKLANVITESEQGAKLPAAEIKALTSGEAMTVDHKYGTPFIMTPFATLFWATNYLPHPHDYSDAIHRRVDIVEFNRTFSEQERDINLMRELKTEMPGILNAALDAYASVVKTGFETPMSVTKAKNDWRRNADPVACWADERLERAMLIKVQSQTAYVDFTTWADENGYRLRLTQKTFTERLQNLGFQKVRTKNAKFWQDVRLVPGVPG
jgi:putative DNA primase/helicase